MLLVQAMLCDELWFCSAYILLGLVLLVQAEKKTKLLKDEPVGEFMFGYITYSRITRTHSVYNSSDNN